MQGLIFLQLVLLPFAIGSVINHNRASVRNTGCEIHPFDGPLPRPLLVRSNNFVYPVSSLETTLKFTVGQTIDFSCPGGQIILGGNQTSFSVLNGTCISGAEFTVNNATYLYSQIVCSTNPVSTARYTNNSCELGGREIEIGFLLTSSRFVRTQLVCFDQTTQTTIYSYYDLVPAVNNQVTGTPRPDWMDPSGFFTFSNVNNYYVRATQRRTINTLLGLAATSTKYIQDNNYFLSRGHLVARSDFFYAAQQNSTFYFLNALPQWQTFNGFNWDQAESDVQDYAAQNNVNLRVWTGGYGVTTLPHQTTKIETPLYLYVNESTRAIPVPEYFWKVVYNPVAQHGVALIGVNNPYKANNTINRFCVDHSDQLHWLTWNKNDRTRGYSWACTVPEFRRIVQSIPNLTINGLLL